MKKANQRQKRYHLVLPEEIYFEIEKIADKRQTTVVDVIRKFIKLGLLAIQIEETSDGALFIREGDVEKHILLI